MVYKTLFRLLAGLVIASPAMAQYGSSYSTNWNSQEASKTVNLYLNPLSAIGGYPAIGGTYLINKRFAIGPEVAMLVNDRPIKEAVKDKDRSGDPERWDRYEIESHMLGVRGDVALDASLDADTFYATAVLFNLHLSIEDPLTKEKASVDGYNLRMLLGYQWMWENFNIRLGGGYNLGLNHKVKSELNDVTKEDIEKGYSGVNFEFILGWAI